jgi:hypothetical protein
VREAILPEEQTCGLHYPPDSQDLMAKLEKICALMDGTIGECIVEAGQLSQLVMGISHALVDLGNLPI